MAPISLKSEKGEGLNVAVVGAGPAGLAAATELVENGVNVVVYEKKQ